MRTPEVTKEKILRHAGKLFNTQGYKATSLSDITNATKLTKGAIYRHFESKEELEGDTLMHLSGIMMGKVQECVKAKTTAPEKLRAVFHYFESYVSHPPIDGGCPLMNVSIESDDTNPRLRKMAVGILEILHGSLVKILSNGIQHGQLKKGIDKDYYATIIIAALEGSMMMSKLKGNNLDIRRTIRHLEKMMTEIEC